MPRTSLLISMLLPLVALACNPNDGKDDTVDTGNTSSEVDVDGDGYTSLEDCDDNDASVNPGATEICNGIDDDCDGETDEGITTTYYADDDGDGFGNLESTWDACEKPAGYVPNGNDCDDSEPASYPGNLEICDGIDNDCDGEIDDGVSSTFYADADGDGFGNAEVPLQACEAPRGYVDNDEDCDDTTARANPDATEICDELDNDCDGAVDEGVTTTFYADVDGDGWGDGDTTADACALPTGYASRSGDCDDTQSNINPDAPEICDGADNDCDGSVDEADAVDAITFYTDADGDTYGDPTTESVSCRQPPGTVTDNTDCDDTVAAINPAATEICDGLDNDCDGDIDEDSAIDASTWYYDRDGDGYGDPATSDVSCTQPTGYLADGTDCDDTDDEVYPGATEVCDGLDNDCDGDVDNNPEDGGTWYADADGDGFGDADNAIESCTSPSGYVANTYDCDDSDTSEPIVVDIDTGSSAGSGTAASPFDSIQDGIDAADACVIVYEGTYKEQIDLSSRTLDVWGVDGEDSTTIDADLSTCTSTAPLACGATVTIAGGGGAVANLHGFTITGGSGHTTSTSTSTTCADSSASHSGGNTCTVTLYDYCGGGLYVEGDDPNLYDLIVEGNELPVFAQTSTGDFTQAWFDSYGGGLCALNANVTLENVRFYENYADQGGAIYASDAATLASTHMVVMENSASDGAGTNLDSASMTGSNMITACNEASTDGGGLFLQGISTSATLQNVVFYQDDSATGATHGAGVYGGSSASLTMSNSIAFTAISAYAAYGSGSGTFNYNDVYNTATASYTFGGTYVAGSGALSADPLFVRATCDGNPNNDDFHLGASSPAIDAGKPYSSYYDTDGSINDMGAYGGPLGDW